jgi:hypothetical protein
VNTTIDKIIEKMSQKSFILKNHKKLHCTT